MDSHATETVTAQEPRFNWREFWVLFAAGMFGVVAVLPYIVHSFFSTRILPLPLWVVLCAQSAQAAVLIAAAVAIGIALGKRCGLRAPILEAWLGGEPVRRRLPGILALSVPAGVIASAIIIVAEKYFFQPRLPQLARAALHGVSAPAWQAFLASFYGGITEELLLRFGVLTLLAWLFGKLVRTVPGRTTSVVFWSANLLAAVLFGAGHLPATAALLPLTPLVVFRAILLNGLAGVVFGYLYWKRGLESAMIAHFSADLVLHVLMPG